MLSPKMNKQNLCNTNDLQSIRASTPMYYLELEPMLPDNGPVESRAIPLNVIVNSPSDHFLVPVAKGKSQQEQVCVFVEPTAEESNLLNLLNNPKYLPVYGNTYSLHTSDKTEVSNSHIATSNNVSVIAPLQSNEPIASNSASFPNNSRNVTEHVKRKEKKSHLSGFVNIFDRVVPPRALAVLPPALHIRRSIISPRRTLPQRVRFGPVQGIKHKISSSEAHEMVLNAAISKTPIFILRNGDDITHIDISDLDKSNWITLLPLGDRSTANVWLYEEGDNLCGITVQCISAGTPLALGYTKSYADDNAISQDQPILDVSENFSEEPRRWWCYECQRAFSTSALLQRHIDQFHTDDFATARRRYRCRHCTHTFSRLFTLRRHVARHCINKSEKIGSSNKTAPPEDEMKGILNTSLNIEDNRLPSDESLQNYTNGLDFSTSLFDTDRMPGLDMSGSSRSETEFNPYGITYRDENELTPGLGFDKTSNQLEKSQKSLNEQSGEQKQGPSESLLISCPYCKQTILREKKRQHLSECTEKRPECECGQKFSNNEKLAEHVHAEHSNTNTSKPQSKESNTLEYKCEKCQYSFKRRGMLVNHLWRVHNSREPVPLERRVRHYPCAVCPKIYRTAAKRDIHQSVHHPGSVTSGRYAIEGGKRCVAPAACAACPRQYATRAKLLQHVRQRHPELAPPLKHPPRTKSTSQDTLTKPAVHQTSY